MKKVIDILKNAFFYTTAIFTAVTSVFMLVFMMQEMENMHWIDIGVLNCTLVFAAISGVCIAAVGAFKKLPAIFRYIIDFVLSYAALFLWFKMLASTASNVLPSHFFVISTVYAVIFALVALFAALFGRLSAENKNGETENKEYEGVFSDVKKEN